MTLTVDRLANLARKAIMTGLTRKEVQSPEAVSAMVVLTVKKELDDMGEVLDYKIVVEDESPELALAREIMEEPASEVRLTVSVILAGRLEKLCVQTLTAPDGGQVVSVKPSEEGAG